MSPRIASQRDIKTEDGLKIPSICCICGAAITTRMPADDDFAHNLCRLIQLTNISPDGVPKPEVFFSSSKKILYQVIKKND